MIVSIVTIMALCLCTSICESTTWSQHLARYGDNVREWGFQNLESCVDDARHQPGPQCPKSLWGDIHPSRRFKQRQRRQRCPWVEAHARCALSNLCMSLATAHWSNRTFSKLAKWASMAFFKGRIILPYPTLSGLLYAPITS